MQLYFHVYLLISFATMAYLAVRIIYTKDKFFLDKSVTLISTAILITGLIWPVAVVRRIIKILR